METKLDEAIENSLAKFMEKAEVAHVELLKLAFQQGFLEGANYMIREVKTFHGAKKPFPLNLLS